MVNPYGPRTWQNGFTELHSEMYPPGGDVFVLALAYKNFTAIEAT